MKIVTLNPSFSGIKTAVYYKWSSFIPTNSEKITDRDKESLIKTHGSSDFYYSGGNSSDFLTFSEYDFKLNPEKEDLRGFVKSNYFDSNTLEKAIDTDTNKYNQDILINFEEYLLPQISEEDFDESNKKFFGTLSNESYSVIYLDIPGDENDSPVWMVELYDDYLMTNHSITNKKDIPFISYELLKIIHPDKITSIPNNIIIFGPEPNYINNFGENQIDYSFYYRKNLDYYLINSSDYIKIPEDDWYSLYREITSKELLKIVISPEGILNKVVNLSRFAWDISKNPNRNQNKYSLRNDEFWATRDYYRNSDDGSPILKDRRSGTIISTKKVEDYESLPILSSKLKGLGKRFSPRRVYKESDVTLVNDYMYSSLISGNLGENPIYSNNWIMTKRFESGDENYVDNYQESLSLLRDKLSGDYYQAYIHINNKNFGKIIPSGQQFFRREFDQEVYIYPNMGYKIEDLLVYVDGKRLSSQKKRLLYSKTEHAYIYKLQKEMGIDSLIDVKILFSPQQKGIIPYSLLGIDDLDRKILLFRDITDNTVGKNLEPGIEVTFVDALDKSIPLTQLEVNDEENLGEILKKDLLEFNENTQFPVRMFISDELSQYSFSGLSVREDGGNLRDLETKVINSKKCVEFEENSETLNVVFKVQPKKLNCRVNSDLGIEVSSIGSYVDYSQNYSFSFAISNKFVALSKIKFNFGSYERVISEPGQFCFKVDDQDLDSRTILEGDLVYDSSKEIYTLSISHVMFSIDIFIESLNITSLN